MAPLSFASSEIISLTIEAFLYGLYIMLLSRCIQVLLRKRQSDSLHTRLVIVTGSIFILVTWHLIIDFIRIIVSVDNSTEVAEVQLLFDDLRSIYSVMKTAVYVATTAISDAFIVYRCYIIWGRKIWVVVLPIVLLLTDIGTGIAAVASLALLNPGETYYVQHQTRITEAFLSITLALNGICTGLIAARIWWHQHTTREFREHSGLVFNLGHVATIMTESAAIYSATLLIMIATYVSEKTLAFNVFLDITSPVIGIVFSLIIVRVGEGTSHETMAAISTFVPRSAETTQEESTVSTIQFSGYGAGKQNPSKQNLQRTISESDHKEPHVVQVASTVAGTP